MITYSRGLNGTWTEFTGRELFIPADYTGNGLLWSQNSVNTTIRIAAPIANISLQSIYVQGFLDLVIEFENGSRIVLNRVVLDNAELSPSRGFLERIDIDLMPFYGINETVSIDFTQPGVWKTINGTSGDDDFEDIIQRRFEQNTWELDFNTVQIGGLGSDDLAGKLRGTDVLFGGPGDDFLDSYRGRNLVYGGAGDDMLFIGRHTQSDYLVSGGAGNDLYIVDMGPSTLANSEWFFTGNFREDGSQIWEQVFELSTSLTPIYDHSGANDRLWLQNEYLSWDSGAGVWVRDEQLLNSDTWTRFEVVGDNLQIATALTQSAIDGSLQMFLGRQVDWWFRSVGFPDPWEPGQFDWSMTEQERVVFNPKDPTTYPGWNELNSEAKKWLEPRLDPSYWEGKSLTYFEFVQRLSWRVNEVTDWIGDDRSDPVRRVERFDGALDQAKANVAFDEANHSTWPYFEFSQNLEYAFDPNMAGLPNLQDVQGGVEILGFAAGADSIEALLVDMPQAIKSYYLDPANQNNMDPIGAEFDRLLDMGFSVGEAVNGALAYAVAIGGLRELKTSHSGIAQTNQDHLLVANKTLTNSVNGMTTLGGFKSEVQRCMG